MYAVRQPYRLNFQNELAGGPPRTGEKGGNEPLQASQIDPPIPPEIDQEENKGEWANLLHSKDAFTLLWPLMELLSIP